MSRVHREARVGECELCGREVRKLTRHHLVPRTRHKNKRNKKTFDRQEIHRTVGLCSPCHGHIHTVLDNKELEREYNTVEALKANPEVAKFVRWIQRKPHGTAGAERAGSYVAPQDEQRRNRLTCLYLGEKPRKLCSALRTAEDGQEP